MDETSTQSSPAVDQQPPAPPAQPETCASCGSRYHVTSQHAHCLAYFLAAVRDYARVPPVPPHAPSVSFENGCSHYDSLVRFISAYESLRHRFGDEYEGRFSECDNLVKEHDAASTKVE